jgi:mRNA interferase RelE/StbE
VTTTPYNIKIAPVAQRQIRALPVKHQKTMIKLIEALAINPRPPGVTRVEGMTGLYREDVEHLRLLYKVEEQEVMVLVVRSE